VDASDPDATEPGRIAFEGLVDQLKREFTEEVGFELKQQGARPLALVRDERARSVDVVMQVDFQRISPPRPKGGSDWEHQAIWWIAVEELGAFAERERVVDSTRALFRAMGWVGLPFRGNPQRTC
jgi:hypothetical protein